MQLSKACLSPWQIELAEIFSSKRRKNTTEENLSRLHSFIVAYVLFDSLYVPEKFRTSPFIGSLDPGRDIFVFDARVSGSYETGSDGQTRVEVDPSLLFKNERHLKSKASAWMKQHIVFDLRKPQRDELIDYLKKSGHSKPWFHKLILAEYQTLFGLSTLNEAFGVLFASVSQVHLPDIAEMPRFVEFLNKAVAKARAPVAASLGVFSFEFPTGALEARIKMPSFFNAFLTRLENEAYTVALVTLRRAYQPLREAFRKIADALRVHPAGELVVSDVAGPEIEEWNHYVDEEFATSDQALLMRSEIVAVKISAGMGREEICRTWRDRIEARGSLLRLASPQDFLAYSHRPGGLEALQIDSVLPFEKKLFRLGTHYRNKRSVLHEGVASAVSFPLWVGAQLPHEGLDDPRVLRFGEEMLPHLYMICTRPRITVSREAGLHGDLIQLEFQFQQKNHVERQPVLLPRCDVCSVSVDEATHTQIVCRDSRGKETSWHASMLYQSMVQSMVTQGNELPLFGNEQQLLSARQIEALERSDLEVIYVGQSKGRDLDRTAITRLGRHEKWEIFYRHLADENPNQEMWIVLISQAPPHHLNMILPGADGNDSDIPEAMRRVGKPASIGLSDSINFIEAGLINYFKPRYNEMFKTAAFPSRRHESYERLFIEPVDLAAIELETWGSLGCRLYSGSVTPRFVHLHTCQLNPRFDLDRIFSERNST